MTKQLYPLKFIPIAKDKIWGGVKLEKHFNKQRGVLPNIGESWELSGVNTNISIVTNGKWKGKTLHELILEQKSALVGEKIHKQHGSQFPLLFKYIDANDFLSIQVHPDDEVAKTRHNSFGKTEMWYVMDADEDAYLIAGFKEKCNEKIYTDALAKRDIEHLLNKIPVKKGDVLYIPAGLIHSIGKGIVVAEIQQTSDITYRIFDYNRKDSDGKTRDLHTKEALKVINFDVLETPLVQYSPKKNRETKLVSCPYFTTNLILADTIMERDTTLRASFTVLMCMEGSCQIAIGKDNTSLQQGETVLLPYSMGKYQIIPKQSVKLLDIHI